MNSGASFRLGGISLGVAAALAMSATTMFAQPGPPAGGAPAGGPPAGGAPAPALPMPLSGDLPPVPEEVLVLNPEGISVTPYVTGLKVVWSLDFAPDGRLFIAEREGRIRVASPSGELDPTPWHTFEGMQVRLEDGLLGLTLHPEFETEPWVYAFYTVQKGDEYVNRVSRFREVNGRSGPEEILIDDLPSFRIHNGGRLRFGPDGMLYVTVGEVSEGMRAQDLNDLAGKILRITPDGKIPADNPFGNSPIWAYGMRNTHGLTFRPSDGALFAADNGPTGEFGAAANIRARDELNIIQKGGNHGWPVAVGAPQDPRYVDPIAVWIPANPPGDAIFYTGDLMPQLKGDLFYSGLSSQALLRFRFQDPSDPNKITAIERWFTGEVPRTDSLYGRLRGMAVGPDGALYVGTGNHDGRSALREGDDRVLRIGPAN